MRVSHFTQVRGVEIVSLRLSLFVQEMAIASKTIIELGEWLTTEGFSELVVKTFQENEIDGEAFLLLTDEELKDIVKLYGPRAKLIKKKKDYALRSIQDSSNVRKESIIPPNISEKKSHVVENVIEDSGLLDLETLLDENSEQLGVTTIEKDIVSPNLSSEECLFTSEESESNDSGEKSHTENITIKLNAISPPSKKLKLAAVQPLPKRSFHAFASKRKQEPPLPMPFQLPVNLNPTLQEAVELPYVPMTYLRKLVSVVADSIYTHKSYPTISELQHVALQMTKKWKGLSKNGSTGHIVTALSESMNYKRKPVESKRGKKRESGQPYKPKAKQMPTLSVIPGPIENGEDEASHDRHVKMLKTECRKVTPRKIVYGELMKRTFAFRRQMVTDKTPSVDHLLSVYPALRFPDEILHEFDRLFPESHSKNICELWESLIPTIFQMAEHETCGNIQAMIAGMEDFSEEYKGVIAACVLYYLLPDVRTTRDHRRIVNIVEATANIKVTAESSITPQPSIIVRATPDQKVKDAFLVIEKSPFACTINPSKFVVVLFCSFFAFNVHYPNGCTTFYTLLEILFINKKVPARKPRLTAILDKLRA